MRCILSPEKGKWDLLEEEKLQKPTHRNPHQKHGVEANNHSDPSHLMNLTDALASHSQSNDLINTHVHQTHLY
jgi:hypothetical protein